MTQLAAALRSGSLDELTELLGAYRDRRFSYRCCLLRNRETALIAVRDALVVAIAQSAGAAARRPPSASPESDCDILTTFFDRVSHSLTPYERMSENTS